MSNSLDLLNRMPLAYRAQIEAEVHQVWEMKRMADEDNVRLRKALEQAISWPGVAGWKIRNEWRKALKGA